ncbi:MAG: YbjN domain-containing protein [Alphaproteobacteria bacterium]|nr:YbjN domain-containing protein [Alphaproteobacteria bacterium]MCW5742490.1 YbjN domain-containing protein [Alphaproteobacteria bacterium]
MFLRSIFAAALVALVPTLAAAQITAPTSGEVDPADLVRVLQVLGNTAKLSIDKDGEPEIEARTQNINFVIFFYNCQKQAQPVRCRSYQFWASFHDLNPQPTLEQINRWNETKRLAQASTDGEGRYRLKMNVNPKGADIDVSFRAYMDWWNLALKEYMQHIGFRK